jgi:hypothetical protein
VIHAKRFDHQRLGQMRERPVAQIVSQRRHMQGAVTRARGTSKRIDAP